MQNSRFEKAKSSSLLSSHSFLPPPPPMRSQRSPKGKKTGREVVSKQEGGGEELARPHGHIGCPQSDCFIQRYLLVLWGVGRVQLHTTHWESLLPGFFLHAKAAAPRSLARGLQRVGQFSPCGGTLGEPVRGELQFHHTSTQRWLQTQRRQRLWLALGRAGRRLTPIAEKPKLERSMKGRTKDVCHVPQ